MASPRVSLTFNNHSEAAARRTIGPGRSLSSFHGPKPAPKLARTATTGGGTANWAGRVPRPRR